MATRLRLSRKVACVSLSLLLGGAATAADKPSPEAVLKKLQPVQKDVQVENPAPADLPKCTIELTDGDKTWVIRDPSGQILRKFVDTNGDKKVDQWCYYKDGIEVYRDIDTNFNEKVDQNRWFNTAGTRWGQDTNEDKQIDLWLAISAEEVSAEVVAAIRDRDRARFERLLLTGKEAKALGLGKAKSEQLAKKLAAAPNNFNALSGAQKQITPETKWVSFGGTLPGLVPAGTDDSTVDLVVYENVAAMVETASKPLTLTLGTMIRVRDIWRLIDTPVINDNETAGTEIASFFFAAPRGDRPEQGGTVGQPSEKIKELLAILEKIDAMPESPAKQTKRAEALEELIKVADTREMRMNFSRQLADSLSAGVQATTYPEGIDRLKALEETLKQDPEDDELAAYAKMRRLFAEHARDLATDGNKNFAAVQAQWIKDLEAFATESKKYPDLAEAVLELAISQEFAGEDVEALKWYAAIEKDFPDPNSPYYRKATGAKTRLQSIGNAIPLQGKTLDGKPFNLASMKNKVVLIQYWATWCEPCKSDMPLLEKLRSKYGKSGFEVVGVCLDSNKPEMAKFLKENDPGWPQLFEEGGLENRYALELGIMNLPTMILVDKQGKVVNRNIRAAEVDAELKNLLK